MFEAVSIQEESEEPLGAPIDLGLLAEAMLYYQRVHLVGRQGALEHLGTKCGPDVLLALLDEGFLSFEYCPDIPVVYTKNTGSTGTERHLPTVVNIGHFELQNVLPDVCARITGAPGKGRRLAKRLTPLIRTFRHEDQVREHAAEDFRDVSYVDAACRAILGHHVPELAYPSPVVGEIIDAEEGFIELRTAIDFQEANRRYHATVPPSHSSLSPAFLLAHLISMRATLDIAAQLQSEMVVTPVQGAVARAKLSHILDRRAQSAGRIERFQECVLDDGRAVREAINGGQRTMEEFVELLRRARRFRDWLEGQPADVDLVKAYLRAVAKQSWLDRLPPKAVRFSLFTLAGGAAEGLWPGIGGMAAGVALGAADTFLLDHLIGGWRPSQFVDGPLRVFANPT